MTGPNSDPGNVLVVDDLPAKRYVLCSWLRRAGYRVLEAATGGEALTILYREPVDVVVLDVLLPDMTGFEVCERIRADPRRRANPVIQMSAVAVDVVDRTEGLSRGADAYLVEPIDPDELLATVRAVLRYYRVHQQLERFAERLGGLGRMAVRLNSATSVRDVLATAVVDTSEIFGTPAMICTETLEGQRVCAVVDEPAGQTDIRRWTNESFAVPVGSVYHDEPAEAWPQLAWPAGTTLRALGARRRADRPPVYVVVPQWATDDGAPVLTQIGQLVVSAIEGVRVYTQEHQLALTLQRSLLPVGLPALAGYEFAVRYVPASDQVEIGGDFYELCQLPGRLAVAIGDVSGHSLHAATIMAEIRHATRAYLAEDHGPAAVLNQLNKLLLLLIPDETATLCLLDIEPHAGTARLANAGHPPPLLISAGRAKFLTRHSMLLGLPGPDATESVFTIDPGAVLVLFTDGLVEQRGRSLKNGLATLVEAARTVEDDLELFCDRLLAEVGPSEPDDDIAIIALRRT